MSITEGRWPVVFTTLLMGVLLAANSDEVAAAVSTDGVKATLQQLPLSFIENKGQVYPKVAYYVEGSTTAIYFTPSGVTFSLSGKQQSGTSALPLPRGHHRFKDVATSEHWTLKLDFIDANLGVKPQGRSLQAGKISYFTGPEFGMANGACDLRGDCISRTVVGDRLGVQRPGEPAQVSLLSQAWRGPECHQNSPTGVQQHYGLRTKACWW